MGRIGVLKHRKSMVALMGPLVLLVAGCGDMNLGAQSLPSVANMAPDPSYQPSVGDRAVLFGQGADTPGDQAPLLKDLTAFDKYERAIKSQSTGEFTEMEERGWLMRTPVGTRVSVMSLKDRTHVGDRFAIEVRLLDGPFKDQTLWTPATLVARMARVQTEPQ